MNSTSQQPKCICGKYLIKVVNQSTVYKEDDSVNAWVYCNNCKDTIPKEVPFWHCDEELNEHHGFGFDLCEPCISNRNRCTEKDCIINLRNEVKNVYIGNMDITESTITGNHLISNRPSVQKYIISEIDAELLILVEFKQAVDLRSIQLFASQMPSEDDDDEASNSFDASPPKLVHIYKTAHNHLNFDDMESMEPDLSITCSSRALKKGKRINLTKIRKPKIALKFKKIKFVAMFIKSNQTDTETTFINGVVFKGQPNAHEKHKILIQEETLATTTLNQSLSKSRWHPTEQSEQKQMEIKHGHFRGHEPVQEPPVHDVNSSTSENDQDEPVTLVGGLLRGRISECNASHCDHLDHVVDVLKHYHRFIECNVQSSDTKEMNINDIFSCDTQTKNNHVTLINDFHHLVQKHRANFEGIYDTLIKECNHGDVCNLKGCVPLRRNHRNRHRLRTEAVEINKLYFNHDIDQDISLQQILDKIHCYYFHTFDIGYKHTTKDMKKILQRANRHAELKSDDDDYVTFDGAIVELASDIRARKRCYEDVEGLEEVSNNSLKFSSLSDGSYGIGLRYNFGVRFLYWPYYEDKVAMRDPALPHTQLVVPDNNGHMLYQLYIKPKFTNIKDELLNNSICTISERQWNILLCKAKGHAYTETIRSIACYVDNALEIYELQMEQCFSIHHVIAFMVYCNFDILQGKFSKTCWMVDDVHKKENTQHMNDDNGNSHLVIETFVERHRNYAHLGRLLRESIECFVIKMSMFEIAFNNPQYRKYYHGINEKSQFSSMIARINAPLSTTCVYDVALSFAGPNGIVVELDPDRSWFRRYNLHDPNHSRSNNEYNYVFLMNSMPYRKTALFECAMVSDFANEHEILFFGGMGNFIFRNIVTMTGEDYRFYVFALIKLSLFLYGPRIYYYGGIKNGAYDDKKTFNKKKRISLKSIKLCVRLILHALHKHFPDHPAYKPLESITEYAQTLVTNHFRSIIYIEFFISHPRDGEILVELCNDLFIDDHGWIKLNLLMTLFPALRFILLSKEKGNDTFCEHRGIYESVLSVVKRALSNDEDSKLLLQSIRIIIPSKSEVIEKAKVTVSAFKARFKQWNWNIYVSADLVDQNASSYIQMEPVFCDRVMTFLRERYQSNHIPDR
eukprot:133485_1